MKRQEEEFYTVRGYSLKEGNDFVTPSMEDYMEMIYRLVKDDGQVRISDLSKALNVQPPSSSKMVQKLSEMGFLEYEKYGTIRLSKEGCDLGEYLINRHEIIEQFFQLIGVADGILEQTEKIEHNINPNTLEQIKVLINFIKSEPNRWEIYRQRVNKSI